MARCLPFIVYQIRTLHTFQSLLVCTQCTLIGSFVRSFINSILSFSFVFLLISFFGDSVDTFCLFESCIFVLFSAKEGDKKKKKKTVVNILVIFYPQVGHMSSVGMWCICIQKIRCVNP